MSVCVVGSIAFDSIETPFGRRERTLGGTAVHFSLAASFFSPVHLVGVVGDDFADDDLAMLKSRGITTTDVERVSDGQTFFWRGRYGHDLNVAETLDTQLNVFAGFEPQLSVASAAADIVFLGNIQPSLQRQVRRQCENARFVALDSMNYWIETARDDLIGAISDVDCVLLNDAETRQLMQEPNLKKAARSIQELGPSNVIAKQGEYGVCHFSENRFFSLPGYPLEDAIDPTGAGDTFAGGFLGYLAASGNDITDDVLRCAMTYGSVLASFNVEGFGTERLQKLEFAEIERRFDEFRSFTSFEANPLGGPLGNS